MGKNVLFVCPTNELAQNNNGVTLNKFFGVGLTEDTHMQAFNHSDYDVIVFEEIYMCNPFMLMRILQFKQKNEGAKTILATGDKNQLEPVDIPFNNVSDVREYMEQCLNQIFPHEVYLEECKRLESESDKQKLVQLEHDILRSSMPVRDIVKKHFLVTRKINKQRNVACTTRTCMEVGKAIRKQLNKALEYEVGEVLICRKYKIIAKNTFNVNFKYKITSITDKGIGLQDVHGGAEVEVKYDMVRSHFIYDYCRTCHSFQGATIEEETAIFDWEHFYVSRYWLWTAITRAKNLNNIRFFLNKESDSRLDYQIIDCYLQKKIAAYKLQDIKAKREICSSKLYVSVSWLSSCFGKCCKSCGQTFSYDISGGNVTSNLTANRVDNNQPHYIDNITPLCVDCNCSLSNK